jgi:hypothetical protein
MKLRIATYNVENLFRRAKILNLHDTDKTDTLLDLVRQLQKLLDQKTYDDALKNEVFSVSKGFGRLCEHTQGCWLTWGLEEGERRNRISHQQEL